MNTNTKDDKVQQLPAISEAEFQNTVIDLAKRCGFEFIYHTWRSDHSPAGFPDLIILKDGRMIVAELKKVGGQLSAEQYFWLLEFLEVTDDVYLWDEDDWNEVLKIIGGRYVGKNYPGITD